MLGMGRIDAASLAYEQVYSEKIQPQLANVSTSAIDRVLASRVGTQAGSGRATSRIQGIGRAWRIWWGLEGRDRRSMSNGDSGDLFSTVARPSHSTLILKRLS